MKWVDITHIICVVYALYYKEIGYTRDVLLKDKKNYNIDLTKNFTDFIGRFGTVFLGSNLL